MISPPCPFCGSTRNPVGATVCAACKNPLSGAIKSPSLSATLATTSGRKYTLSSSGPTLIGSRGCAILLSGPGIEPQHAKLMPSAGGFTIEPVMGTVLLNGKSVSSASRLDPGAVLTIGSQTMTYSGPSAGSAAVSGSLASLTSGVKSALVPTKGSPSSPLARRLPAMPAMANITKFVSKIFRPDPALDGTILVIDGPHMEKPDLHWAGLLLRIGLGLLLLPLFVLLLVFLPSVAITFLIYGIGSRGTPQLPARYLRVQDKTGKQYVVKMKGDIAAGMLQQGDDALFWGSWHSGNLMMDRALNRVTNAPVTLKTAMQRKVNTAIVWVLLFLCLCSNLFPLLLELLGAH